MALPGFQSCESLEGGLAHKTMRCECCDVRCDFVVVLCDREARTQSEEETLWKRCTQEFCHQPVRMMRPFTPKAFASSSPGLLQLWEKVAKRRETLKEFA